MSLDMKQVLDKLPSMAKEVENLLDTLKQDFVEPKVLESKLVACPVISARVLQISNSSFYGLNREISSLREATIILGQHTLRSLVYSLAAMDEFKGNKNSNANLLDYKVIWQHSLYAACLARSMAELKKLNASDIFTASLFQHFGILILESIEKDKIQQAFNKTETENQSFKQTILETTGLNYVSLSAEALNYWHFPVSVCDLIHSVEELNSDMDNSEKELKTETNILLFSNFIAAALFKSPLSINNAALEKSALSLFETEKSLWQLLEKTDVLFAQMASNFID